MALKPTDTLIAKEGNPMWLTNDPEAAKILRAIDRAYDRGIEKCSCWPLEIKISYQRKLREKRQEAYDRVNGKANSND